VVVLADGVCAAPHSLDGAQLSAHGSKLYPTTEAALAQAARSKVVTGLPHGQPRRSFHLLCELPNQTLLELVNLIKQGAKQG
jgi:hypothetical protein